MFINKDSNTKMSPEELRTLRLRFSKASEPDRTSEHVLEFAKTNTT